MNLWNHTIDRFFSVTTDVRCPSQLVCIIWGWVGREGGRVEGERQGGGGGGGVFPASYFCTECEVLGQLSAGESKQNAVDNYNDASLVFRFC